MDKITIFPGSFDPFHKGHKYVVETALNLFDKVVICIAVNPSKKGYFEHAARMSMIEEVFKNEPRVSVISTHGLISEKAKEVGASFIIKGARNGNDFTDEVAQADINTHLCGIPTLVIPTPNHLSFVSSTAIRSILQNGHGEHNEILDYMMC